MKNNNSKIINTPLSYLAWPFFLIWPFGMFLIAIKNFNIRSYRIFILLFFMFFGLTFVIQRSSADSYKHKLKFDLAARQPDSDIYKIVDDFVNLKGEELDVYVPIVNYVISRFTTELGYVFAFHAFVFGFFYLKSISFIYDEFGGQVNLNAYIFLIMFVMLFSIHQINAVRYYTATWIWIYGALQLLSRKKIKYIFICFAASLVHFGITPASFVLLTFFLLGPRDNLYFPLLIVSFIVGNFFQLDALVDIGNALSPAAEKRAKIYTNMDVYADKLDGLKQTQWFIQWRGNLIHYYLLFAFGFIYLKRKAFNWDKKQKYLLSFLMLYLSFVNFVIQVPSFGGRMRFLFWIISAYFLYRFFQLNPFKKAHILFWLGLFPIILWALVELRIATEFMNTIAVFGNVVLAFIVNTSVSVYEAVLK